jgi:membrane fusion protein
VKIEPPSLFRKEVLERRADRIHGDISLAVPVSWHVIGYTLLAALIGALLFVAFAPYARVETVGGSIALDTGMAPIVSHRHGTVTAVRVRDGDRVKAGAPLAEIRSEDATAAGRSPTDLMLEAVERQAAGLSSQAAASREAARAEASRLTAQLGGLRRELASIDQQVSVQRQMLASAATELETVQDIAKRGFISRRDVVQREESVLSRRQQLAQVEQTRAAKQSAIAEAERGIAEARARQGIQTAGITISEAELTQRRVDAQSGRGFLLTAPVDGIVTGVSANPGQSVGDDQALMTLIPTGSAPVAELEIPSRAIGFVEVGQKVKLAVDAFPYQTFGTVDARIVSISGATVNAKDPSGATVAVYRATARIDRPWVTAFGKRHQLLPGMSLSARIVTERQSLLHWLFEPLFAVGRR